MSLAIISSLTVLKAPRVQDNCLAEHLPPLERVFSQQDSSSELHRNCTCRLEHTPAL